MAHYNLGVVLIRRNEWRTAADAFKAAIAVDPDLALAQAALGAALYRTGEPEQAEARLRKALALDPRLTFARLQLAEILRAKGELAGARRIYDSILAKVPDNPEARFGRGFLRLLQGELRAGWQDYEYRSSRRGAPDPALLPQWRGEDVADKTLLLYAEQGIGDTIQFLRYASVLAGRGASVFVAVPVPVMKLASGVAGVHAVVPPTLTLPPFDFCAPFPSLPGLCGTTLQDIPWSGPYLSPSAGRVPGIPAPGTAGLVVGLAWAGNPDHPNDRYRSMTVEDIQPLVENEGIQWLILQQGRVAAELDRLRRPNIVQLGSKLNDFSDISAVMSGCDLVISVDTSFCHLAGALGLPVWTLLSHAPDWRWLLDRADTPWYPSMRLFRQKTPGDWGTVIADVSQALTAVGA